MTYPYLTQYIGHNDLSGNYFLPVSEEEIKKAENILGYIFPSELKLFYQEIGSGTLSGGEKNSEKSHSLMNDILPPLVSARFATGVLRWDDQEHWMLEATYELLSLGDLPVFEIADSTSFMVMKPLSDNPNAVWYQGYEKIEDSFEKFIYNLYYDDPAYYIRRW